MNDADFATANAGLKLNVGLNSLVFCYELFGMKLSFWYIVSYELLDRFTFL